MDKNWTTPRNWVGNTLPDPGDDLLFVAGARHPQNQNDFAPGTTFNSLELRGSGGGGYQISGNLIALNAGLRVENNSGMPINHVVSTPLLLSSNQTFSVINGGGTFALTGPVDLNGREWVWDVAALSDTTVQGVLSASGSLVKTGAGPLTLSADNTYTGVTRVEGGTLRVNGWQSGSPVALVAGNLTGNGSVGNVTSVGEGGVVSIVVRPGNDPGILTCSNLSLNGSTFFVSQLHGSSPGSGYAQLRARGWVSLGEAGLSLILTFAPALGVGLVLIDNDGVDPVEGSFAGYPEGRFFTMAFGMFRITYRGGDGNDVVITRVNPPAQLTGVARVGGGVEIQGQGLPDLIYGIQGATNLDSGAVWAPLGTATANGAGNFAFTDAEAGLFSRRFYRVVSP